MSPLIFVRFRPLPGNEGRVEQILRLMVRKTREEPGNRRYDLYTSPGGDGRIEFNLIESYVDDDAIRAHRETEHYRDYRLDIVPLLEIPIAVTLLQPLDTLTT